MIILPSGMLVRPAQKKTRFAASKQQSAVQLKNLLYVMNNQGNIHLRACA